MSELIAASVNGKVCGSVVSGGNLADRGFHYGDGLFETMLVAHGEIVEFARHYERLVMGCGRLEIEPPERAELKRQTGSIIAGREAGILKLILSRATGGRGYKGPATGEPNSTLLLYDHSASPGPSRTIVRWCTTRMARNALLAGIKHLNRLEQVMAQREWWDESIGEGLMLDTEGELICGTASNVFMVANGVLYTPDLRYCGVRGTMRARVFDKARELNLEVVEGALWPDDFDSASEAFVTNAVWGIRPIVELGGRTWELGSYTRKLAESLRLW